MSQDLMNIVLSVLPMLLLVGALLFVMPIVSRRLTGPGSASANNIELLERQARALERIADALEKRGAP